MIREWPYTASSRDVVEDDDNDDADVEERVGETGGVRQRAANSLQLKTSTLSSSSDRLRNPPDLRRSFQEE